MKNVVLLLLISAFCIVFACKKETKSQQFLLLTGPVWASDSLLVNGVDASGPGQKLTKFKGDVKFSEDGTGYFGQYIGKWRFAFNESELIIESDSLLIPLTTNIVQLTTQSLKISTNYPNLTDLSNPFKIRMTFSEIMRYLVIPIVFILSLLSANTLGQGIVKGIVFDNNSHEPLAGVYVVYGKSLGTTTDTKGLLGDKVRFGSFNNYLKIHRL